MYEHKNYYNMQGPTIQPGSLQIDQDKQEFNVNKVLLQIKSLAQLLSVYLI